LGFFSNFLGSRKKTTNDTKQEQNINYKADLVGNLKGDHRNLVNTFQEIVNLMNANSFVKIPEKLKELKIGLQSHVLVENVHFYVYLEQKYGADPDQLEFIRDIRKEMNSISKTVVQFVKKYEMKVLTADSKEAFSKQLNKIGQALTQRIELEETQLYTLYTS